MKTLIIDAGHGGNDPGATGFQMKEKDWNLKMSLYQYNRLKEMGANVALTRSSDETLSATARTNKIKSKYDYCISNHFNAFNGEARGIETIHSIHSIGKLAIDIADALHDATKLPLRRVFNRRNSAGKDWYFMHRLTGSTQTVIIEYGFIDHAKDVAFYRSDENFIKAAEAVIKVLCVYLGVKYQTPKATLYRVQVGAFQSKENANNLVYQLKKLGYDPFITV